MIVRRGENKYHAKRSLFGGRLFESQAERDYYGELLLREKAGEVRDIECQPVVDLVAGIRYRPDFLFCEKTLDWPQEHPYGWTPVYVDVKGVETEVFRLKCKLWKCFGPGPLRVVKRGSKRLPWVVVKEIIPTGSIG